MTFNNYIIYVFIFFVIISFCELFVIIRILMLYKNIGTDFENYIAIVTNTINSVRYGNLTKKIDNLKIPNSQSLTESLNRMIETLHDREIMIVEYQNELANRNKFLEAIINSLSDGLIVIDENNMILRVTNMMQNIFGTDKQNIIGKSLSDFIDIPIKKPLKLLNNDAVIVNNAKELNFIASSVELKIENDKKGYIIILKNITDQKELETLKEDFVATLTHDLKVPIIAETNMLDLFLNKNFGEISPKQEIALQNMQASNKELLDLVQTVLDTYKYKDRKIGLYKENIMLKSFIEEIIDEMRPVAQKTQNELIFRLNRDIRVFADKFQLKRVLKNIVQNAISYGEAKTPVEISIGEIPEFVVIKIKDKGAGISKEDMDKIFNRYYSAAKKFRKIGTGLGLYLAQQIIKAHDGELNVESKKGEFTEFCIKLPVNKSNNDIIW